MRSLLVLLLAIQNFSVYAQTYPVQIQPTISFPSTFLTDYNDPSNLNVRVFLSDITKMNYRIRLKVKLTSEKFSAISVNGIELILQGGQVYFLSDTELGDLFTPSNLLITTNVPTNTDNSLPEGVYTMAFEAYDATVPGNIVVSNAATDFTVFSVNHYDPPMLTSPANKEAFDVMTINQNIFFTWTPRHIVFSPKQQVKYRFRLIKVQPVDRNPYDAMNVTLPAVIDQDGLDFPVFVYTPADLPLEEGCVYAWQVSAYEEVLVGAQIQRSSARFKNLGQSEVFTFSIKENCQPVTPIKAPVVSKNLVALQWNYDPSHKEYEIAYRPFATSLPWTPVTTVANLYNLDNTVLQAGVTYEYTIKAQCKNWTDAVYGGTFTMAVPTCSAPEPVSVDNSGTEKTILTWPEVNGATAYRFQYKSSSTPSDPYTSFDLTSSAQSYDLPKLTAGGYIIKVDAVCDAETAEGKPNTIAFDETGVVGPCPIPTPFQLVATRIKSDTAQLSWPVSTAHTGYSITYWHRDSSAVKRTITSTDPRVIAGYIYDDQLYYYQITFLCGTKSTTTPPGMFRVEGNAGGVVTDPTTANCFPPAVLQAEPRSTTSAIFDWSKVDGVDEYQLFYSVNGANQFKPFNTISNSAQIKDLVDSEKYQYMVRSRCGGKYSIFSDTALVDLAGGKTNANCDSAAYFITKGQTTTGIRLCWPNKAADTGYKLTYREEAQSPADEYTQTFADMVAFKRDHLLNDTLRYTFDNLKSGTAYIFKLQVLCGTDEALRNAPLKVSTVADAKSTGECGKTQSCDKTNVTPLASLAPGDSIHCADYGILVDKITASNAATGTYTGSGFMNMPFPGLSDFVRMSVSFTNVKINAKPNSCIYDGTINIDSVNASAMPLELRDKIKAAEEQITSTIEQAQTAITAAQEGIDQAQEALQTAVDYFQGGDNVGGVQDGGLGETTTTQTITLPTTATISGGNATLGGKTFAVPGLIKDATGNVFQVSPNGTVTHVGVYDPALASDPTLDLADGKMVYAENTTAKYDYDEWKSIYAGKIQVEREYEKIGTDYYVPAKLILPGQLDKVNASLVGASYDKTKIKFANGKGMVYDHTLSGNTFTINIAGGPAADGQYIYAWFIDGTTKKAIGKLLVPSYAPQQKQVVIIPVGKSVIDGMKYEKGLNDVYGKLGITYTVTVDDSFKDNKAWDADEDGKVQASGSKLLSTDYKGEEAAMILAYANSKGGPDKLDPNTAYFLAVYEAANLEDNLLGKMPAEEQFGFIYVGGAQETSLIRTISHEVGHGAYHMEHSFHNIYLGADSKTKTNNIMDYSTGLDLWKYQWDIVHDPGHVWGILKRDKDAEANEETDECKYTDLVNNAVLAGRAKIAILGKGFPNATAENGYNVVYIGEAVMAERIENQIKKRVNVIVYTVSADQQLNQFIKESVNKIVCTSTNAVFLIREMNGSLSNYKVRTSKDVTILPIIKAAIIEKPNVAIAISYNNNEIIENSSDQGLKSIGVAFDKTINTYLQREGRVLVNNPCYIRGHINLRWYMQEYTYDFFPVAKKETDTGTDYIYDTYTFDPNYTGIHTLKAIINKYAYYHSTLPVSEWPWLKRKNIPKNELGNGWGTIKVGKKTYSCVTVVSKELVTPKTTDGYVDKDVAEHRLELRKVPVAHGESMNPIGYLSLHGWEATYCNYFVFDLEKRIFNKYLFSMQKGCGEMFTKLLVDQGFLEEWKEIDISADNKAIFTYCDAGYLVHIWTSGHISTPYPNSGRKFIQSGAVVGENVAETNSGYTADNISNKKVRAFVYVGNIKKGFQYLSTSNVLFYSDMDKYNTMEELENKDNTEDNNDYDTQY